MTQVLFFIALHLLGILVGLRMWPQLPTIFTTITGFLWGALCWVLLITVYVILGIHYTLEMMALPLLALAVVLIWQINWQLQKNALPVIALGIFGFLIIYSIPIIKNYTFLTNDSWVIISSSRLLPQADTTHFAEGRAIFLTAMHSAGALMGDGYLAPLSTAFTSAGLAMMVYIMGFGLNLNGVTRRTRIVVPVLVLLYLLTSPAIRYQFSNIHENMPVGAYMTATIGALWLGLCTENKAWRIPAMIGLIGVSLLRVEMTLFTILIIAIYVSIAPMSYRERLIFALVPSIPIIIYQAFVLTLATEDSFVTVGNQALMIGGLVGINLGLAISFYVPIKKYLLPNIWWLLLLGMGVGLGIAFATKPNHMTISASMMVINLVAGGWGTLWIILFLFAYFSLFLPTIPYERFLVSITVFSVMLTLLIVYVRETPYRIGYGDSANRMLLHILFIFVPYLVIKYGRATRETRFVIPLIQKFVLGITSLTLLLSVVRIS